MARKERKPGGTKHAETNESGPFAYCCILIRWLQESVLGVLYYDRGEIVMVEGGEWQV